MIPSTLALYTFTWGLDGKIQVTIYCPKHKSRGIAAMWWYQEAEKLAVTAKGTGSVRHQFRANSIGLMT